MKHKEILLGVATAMIFAASIICAAQTGTKEVKVKVSELPAAVLQTIKSECPNCTIDKATREKENGVTVYDFEFKTGEGEMDVSVDGLVIDRETAVQTSDVPAPALAAIRKAGGTIKQVARDEVRAELKNGKVIKLDNPSYLYEADLVKGNKVAEIVVTPEGEVKEGPKWRAKGAREN